MEAKYQELKAHHQQRLQEYLQIFGRLMKTWGADKKTSSYRLQQNARQSAAQPRYFSNSTRDNSRPRRPGSPTARKAGEEQIRLDHLQMKRDHQQLETEHGYMKDEFNQMLDEQQGMIGEH